MNETSHKKHLFKSIEGGILTNIPLAYALSDITVTLKSGETTYCFTDRYDGSRGLPVDKGGTT
jgi:ethanolamine utilization microcompartment shell protein EutS